MKQQDPKSFELLTKKKVHFHRIQKNFESLVIAPILQVNENNELEQIRYSYFTMDPFNFEFEDMIPFYDAYRKFDSILQNPKYNYRFQLEPGDYVIYNNHTCVHAREGFEGDRHLRGVYFDHKQVMTYLKDPNTKFITD